MSKKKKSKKQTNLDNWANFITGLGQRGRDKSRASTFCASYRLTAAELDELYRSDGLARRIVNLITEEMVRQGWTIENEPTGKVNTKLQNLNINNVMMDMIRWARLYGGSLGVLGITDGRPIDQPLNYNNIKKLDWIRVYDRFSTNTMEIDSDINSPNYGNPIMYMVNDSRTGVTYNVHHSRVLKCDWNELTPRWLADNQSWGDSVFQSIYEELKNYSVAFANCGLLIHDFVNYVLKVPDLVELIANNSCNTVEERAHALNMSKSSLNTMIIDSQESYEKVTTNVSGISDLLDRFMLSLSAVSGIPISLLFGRSPSGLNATGESETRNFYDMIKQKQEGKLKPMLNKVIEIVCRSSENNFNELDYKNFNIDFVSLWQNTEEQEATLRRTVAETDAIYIDRGVLDPSDVTRCRFGGDSWSMETKVEDEDKEIDYDENALFDGYKLTKNLKED